MKIKTKKGKQGYTLAQCPICDKWYLEQALTKQISQTSTRELASVFSNMLERIRGHEHTFSKLVALRNMPHYSFRRKYITNKATFVL